MVAEIGLGRRLALWVSAYGSMVTSDVALASGVALAATGLWQAVQLSAAKLAWFSGNGFSLPAPWQTAQSLYVSPSIGWGIGLGPPAALAPGPPGVGVGPGWWQTRHDSTGRPSWFAGIGLMPFGPWHASHFS